MSTNNLVEVASFSYPHEAHIAKASLEAAEIPAFIANEHLINMQWLYSNALGGVKLLVPKTLSKQAKELLATDFSESLKLKKLFAQIAVVQKLSLIRLVRNRPLLYFFYLDFHCFFTNVG